ncbi:hypothetical protein AVEN_97307-1 [Araneus ventricosus]|uniref:Uncharacterized protein n=1 Tax=Araneus ventricosus TaxID=182803 RepID=A0A4Y2HPY1_ARAVE|nr:hypothetical protein AVEN_97307-1 [Araneus ventricosus]
MAPGSEEINQNDTLCVPEHCQSNLPCGVRYFEFFRYGGSGTLPRHSGGRSVWGKVVRPCLTACDDPEKKVRDEEARQAVKNFFSSLGTDCFQDSFLKLISRYDKCTNVGGEFVEK